MQYRVRITNLPSGTDWKALKDHVRSFGDPIFVDVAESGEGVAEFASARVRDDVVSKLDGAEFRGQVLGVKVVETETRRGVFVLLLILLSCVIEV